MSYTAYAECISHIVIRMLIHRSWLTQWQGVEATMAWCSIHIVNDVQKFLEKMDNCLKLLKKKQSDHT